MVKLTIEYESSEERIAAEIAIYYHRNQQRKYTGEPYVNHCSEVAEIVKSVPHDTPMACAAWLHDTLEDTDLNPGVILSTFGIHTLNLVWRLTHAITHQNRTTRKTIDRETLSKSSPKVQTIKLADILSNTDSIAMSDKKFSAVFLPEMRLLHSALLLGDSSLRLRVDTKLRGYGY